jgi:hypothetical protein
MHADRRFPRGARWGAHAFVQRHFQAVFHESIRYLDMRLGDLEGKACARASSLRCTPTTTGAPEPSAGVDVQPRRSAVEQPPSM